MIGLALPLLGLLSQPSAPADWIAITSFLTDAWCTTAHDLRSGVRVTDCANVPRSPDVPDRERCGSAERFVSVQVRNVRGFPIRVVECSNPNWDVQQLSADVGEEGMRSSCLLRTFAEWHAVPAACTRQYVLLTEASDRWRGPYGAIVCSDEQLARALEYVGQVTAGAGPTPVREPPNGPKAIPLERTTLIPAGHSLAEVLAEYGPPDSVWPRYPDGLALVYPISGAPGFAVIEFDRTRTVARVSIQCSEDH